MACHFNLKCVNEVIYFRGSTQVGNGASLGTYAMPKEKCKNGLADTRTVLAAKQPKKLEMVMIFL